MYYEYLTGSEQILHDILMGHEIFGLCLYFASLIVSVYCIVRLIIMHDINVFMHSKFKNLILILNSYYIPLFFLVVVPFAFLPTYQSEKGHSIVPYLETNIAGLLSIPIYAIAIIFLTYFFYKKQVCLFSILLQTYVTFYSAWIIYLIIFERYTEEAIGNLPILAVLPVLYCITHCLIFLMLMPKFNNIERSLTWSWTTFLSGSLIVSIVISFVFKYRLAWSFFERIPKAIPPDYGDCFIVSTCVHGHRKLVRSYLNNENNLIVNRQLIHFREFESRLKHNLPIFHFCFRKIYNKYGPCIAKRIQYRVVADIIYYLLKPMELVACMYCKLKNYR